MKITVYSRTHPAGVEKDSSFLTPAVIECIETTGVFRGNCPCCTLPIVVREPGAELTAIDEHHLLHGDQLQ